MVVEEGQLKGSFKGFRNRDTVFEFTNGHKWRQAEYKYFYRYLHMPFARVVESGGCFMLEVEEMDETVEVRRA